MKSATMVETANGHPYSPPATYASSSSSPPLKPALQPPHLRKTKTSSQLIVNGSPFLMLAAELHNSSLSSAAYMSGVWPEMRKMHVNTLLGSVTWEMVEPVEGKFDFDELDKVILGAREHGMKLVLLWFGSFKNAMSTYVPGWVKRDVKRFPRVHIKDEEGGGGKLKTIELVSPFAREAWEADAKAFGKLMRHLKEFDSQHSTVLMVQVENETGLLGDSRDRSAVAEKLFAEPVPEDVVEFLRKEYDNLHPSVRSRFSSLLNMTGPATWSEVFGNGPESDEMFMANAFSKYIGYVSAAGKAEYDIPYYVNVWLNFDDSTALDLEGVPIVVGGGAKPGIYPSGGPVPHTMDLYKFNAPGLDFVGPDLYLHDYETVCTDYRHQNQPLFIPEQKRDEKGARRIWLAYGTYLAIGCSPFGIDSMTAEECPFTRHYSLLQSVSSIVLDAQANRPDDMMGFFFDDHDDKKEEKQWVKQFGEFEITIQRSFVFGKPGPGAGMIIRQPSGAFLLIGWGFQVVFKSTNPKSTFTGILYSEEKIVDSSGKLHRARVMNGDETRSGAFYIMPNEDPDYGGFPIAVTIPSRTMLAECTPYSLEESEGDL